jgi:regulator of sirC expression with transglutaminase-like and TPR domain
MADALGVLASIQASGVPTTPAPLPRAIEPRSGGSSRAAHLALLIYAVILAIMGGSVARAHEVATTGDPNFREVRSILQAPEADIDLAKVELSIEHMIDPAVDVGRGLEQLDAMADGIRKMLPAGASSRLTLDALRYHLYQPSPWNDHRPYSYDLDDPFGEKVHNKLLTAYIASRKGNCVSMPLLFVVLGQKLGLDVTASLAPSHVFVKYRDNDGKLYNVETTSGAGFSRDVWMRQQFPMTDDALSSGIYMRPLTKKETAVVMVGTLLQFYEQRGLNDQVIRLADLAHQYSPKDVSIILAKRHAYFMLEKREFIDKYSEPSRVPLERRPQLAEFDSHLKGLYDQAYALGWRPPDAASEASYLQTISHAKSSH